jgi:hypothetical protein
VEALEAQEKAEAQENENIALEIVDKWFTHYAWPFVKFIWNYCSI